MALRNYSNTAVEASLTVPVDDVAGSITVSSVAGFPPAPFTILIDPDTESEEACLVTLVGGLSLNVTRGFDGTTALPHVSGAIVKHAALATDFREANEHVFETEYVHGTTSDVVGVSDAQTLSNKNISGLNNTITDIPMGSVAGLDDALDLKADLAGATFTGPVSLPAATTIGTVDATEISYLDGATSNIQDQIDALDAEVDTKAPIHSPTFTGSVTLPSSTVIGTVSAGEIAALDGVIGNLQSQISGITGGGVAVPPGGDTDWILVKNSPADYDMAWKPITDFIFIPGTGSNIIYADGSMSGGDSTGTFFIGSQRFRYHMFTTTGITQSLTVTSPVVGQLLVVGAGGGGGGYAMSGGSGSLGGGGGAGGLWKGDYAFGTGVHNCVVGVGGAGGPGGGLFGNSSPGNQGGGSWFDYNPVTMTGGIYCPGGGGGGGSLWSGGAGQGGDGGSGGGGNPPGNGTPGYGYNGSGSWHGGGAGGAPDGLTLNFTGTPIEYARGGNYGSGVDGIDGRGNGGGGSSYGSTSPRSGNQGGDGVIIALYRIA